jgi:3-oxoacyl-[acyl-carrier-protein] synthase-3
MRHAKTNITSPYEGLPPLVEAPADDEQSDYTILFENYQRAGDQASSVDTLKRNAGGETLNAYMCAVADTSNPVGLLGATYIPEGTGQRIIAHLMPGLHTCDDVPHNALRFLHYRAENDIAHLER